jgi:PAS domain S-box-containing protein
VLDPLRPEGFPPGAGLPAGFGLELAREVAAVLVSPRRAELRDQLRDLARVITKCAGIPRVMVVALDEDGLPLTSGSEGLAFGDVANELEGLFKLHESLRPEHVKAGWIEIEAPVFQGSGPVRCLPVHGSRTGQASGLVLAGAPAEEELPSALLQTLEESSVILAAAIESAIRAEAWNRIEALQRLAQDTFHTKDEREWDLQTLAGRLAWYFEADAVTLLLKDQEELRLAASTDPELGRNERGPVVYRRGEGLTGYVFETGKALRLSNTKDVEEIRKATGMTRTRPVHPERDQQGSFTGQFMGVPLRFGGKVVGVLRMSRRGGVARFTREDQKALQFFADLLGAALAPSWDLLLERSVVESVTESIAVTRRESSSVHRLVMANPGAVELLGRSESQIRGLEASEIYGPGEYDRLRLKLQDALAAGRKSCGPFQTWLKRPDGTVVPVTISYQFLANHLVQPPTLYTIGLARDISQSESLAAQHQRLLEFFETLGIAYFRADTKGMTIESTKLDSVITGHSREDLKTLPRKELYEDLKYQKGLFEQARRNRGKVAHVVVQMRRKDGELFWAEGDLRIVYDPTGQVEVGYEGCYRDVSERMRLQGFLRDDVQGLLSDHELFTRLKQEAEFHLDYLTSLGHQLQTPLSSLIQTLRALEKGVKSRRDVAERLPYVIGQAVVCTRLVRNLSYMDKILRGEPFERERVSLARLSIETKLDFIHLLREKKMDLIVDDASLDRLLRVQGHQEMLRQVTVNLVDNAIKYSFRETTIQIRARQWPDGPSFEIVSTGLPIPEAERDKIFQRGHRTRKAEALIPHGTGLGLWLVRKIVEAHGATIRFHEINEGGEKRNLFRICFPQPARPRRTS